MRRLTSIPSHRHIVTVHRVTGVGERTTPLLWLIDENEKITPFIPLSHYFTEYKYTCLDWKRKSARIVGLFYDFVTAYRYDPNSSFRSQHSQTLLDFVQALRFGTIPTDGRVDPLGLNWAPMTFNSIEEGVRHLDLFTDFMLEMTFNLSKDHPLSKLKRAFKGIPRNPHEVARFLLTARKLRSKSFLSHLKSPDQGKNLRNGQIANFISQRPGSSGESSQVMAMSHEVIAEIMRIGFIKDESSTCLHEREDITAKMVFMLSCFGGLRPSEPLHIWFNDFSFPVIDGSERCIPYLRHPSQAQTFLTGENTNRLQYLIRQGLLPRDMDESSRSRYAGWKNIATEKDFSTPVYLIHQSAEAELGSLYRYYLQFRGELMRDRIKAGGSGHPWLFVSKGEDRAKGMSYMGAPYSVRAFRSALQRALDRVERSLGFPIKRDKNSGNTPHGLRHAYAQMLIDGGAPRKAIQKALHHRHPLSQDVYTAPDWKKVNDALNGARQNRYNQPLFSKQEYRSEWK